MPRSARYVADPRLDGAEVLADDDGVGPVSLQREDADHRLVVVADVGARGRPGALRDPPQPEQPDHVVDPQPARVAQRRRDQPPERLVRRLGQPVGPPRWLLPVLAVLVVRVGRRADGDPGGVRLLQRPRVRAAPVHADREVGHHAEAHAGPAQLELGRGELLVEHPLQPLVELDGPRRAPRGTSPRRAVRVPQLGGPGQRVGPVHLGDGRPGGVVVETAALAPSVALEGQVAARRRTHLEDLAQRGPLGAPRRVAVDPVGEPGRRPSRAARAVTPGRPGSAPRARGCARVARRSGCRSGAWSAGTATAPSARPARRRAAG